MLVKLFIVATLLTLASCYEGRKYIPITADKRMPKSFANATLAQKEGWKYGCESGIAAGGNHFHRLFYKSSNIDGNQFANSEEYRLAWQMAFNYCMYYQYHRTKLQIWQPYTKGLIF